MCKQPVEINNQQHNKYERKDYTKESGANKDFLTDDANGAAEDINYKEYVTVPSKRMNIEKINGKKVEEFLANPEFL